VDTADVGINILGGLSLGATLVNIYDPSGVRSEATAGFMAGNTTIGWTNTTRDWEISLGGSLYLGIGGGGSVIFNISEFWRRMGW